MTLQAEKEFYQVGEPIFIKASINNQSKKVLIKILLLVIFFDFIIMINI